jgi:CHAT domain-containing protein/tetratricopeptide (TPR) repeat protein
LLLLLECGTGLAALGIRPPAGSPWQRAADPPAKAQQKDDDTRVVEPAKPVERELAGGEAHSYRLRLVAGQFCHLVVDQRGIDVVVGFYGPGGEKIVEVDSPNGANGPELVSLAAEASGDYRLEVRSPSKNAPAGRYELKVEELRAATPQDRTRVAAQKASTDAKSLRNQRTAESMRRAISKYQEALSLWKTVGDQLMEAYTLQEMGLIYSDLSDYQKALDSYSQAGAIYKVTGDLRGQIGIFTNIGWIYGALGDYEKAIEFYERAVRESRATGDRYVNPVPLSNIGSEYARLGQYQKALDIHLQVLALRQASNDRGGQAITLANIANCYAHLGQRQKALEYYNQALDRMPDLGYTYYTAKTFNNVGEFYQDLGDNQKALDYFSQALQLRRGIGDRNGEAATLSSLARLERDRGNLARARNYIEAALAAVESLRAAVASQDLRASFFASVRQYHEIKIDLLARLHMQYPTDGFDALALQASEGARARSLLELLAEAAAEIRQDVNPALIEREGSLRQIISDKANDQMRLLRGTHTEEEGKRAAREIDALTAEYEQIQGQIRVTSPRYWNLTQPLPLTLPEIQQQVLDDDTLLLEYSLGDERSYLWAVTTDSIRSFELPGRTQIEAVARGLFEILTARNKLVQNETEGQRRQRWERADAEYPRVSEALSGMLLGPAASELGKKRLLIVAEGVLQYIPFAALPEPVMKAPPTIDPAAKVESNKPSGFSDQRPLIVEHEVVGLPSASVLAVIRRETTGRKPPDKTVAVLADPVFDGSDPRVRLRGENRPEGGDEKQSGNEVRRSPDGSGLRDFVRLRFSRQEANQIARFAGQGKKLTALDFAASRGLATSPELAHYAIVHFATHGLINNQHPELSGIVLSLVDEQGRPQNGFLRLYDIYNLKLQADLVVLSACQTGVGKDIKGEGLVGLTRGFMYAGAARVIASLWQVDDRATADFMGRFYEAMLGRGLKPAAALRSAQLSALKDKRWQAPYYWSAFTLQGEWR